MAASQQDGSAEAGASSISKRQAKRLAKAATAAAAGASSSSNAAGPSTSTAAGNKAKSTPTPAPPPDAEWDAAAFEATSVHAVYDAIAPHFSSTRHSPWPLIPRFLAGMPPGSLGADVGCGNGKYMRTRGDAALLGVDRSEPLVRLARDNHEPTAARNGVAVGDALASGLRHGAFDYAISIATIHHLSTPARRAESVRELIRLVRPLPRSQVASDPEALGAPGRFLIFVWALEQRGQERRRFDEQRHEEASRSSAVDAEPAQDDSHWRKEQDLLVPWVMQQPAQPSIAPDKAQGRTPPDRTDDAPVYQRYYHVFREGELEALVDDAAQAMPAVEVRRHASGWERGNWWGVWDVREAAR